MAETFDTIVVGGGPAGCAAALSLARRGCSSVILERSDFSAVRIGETLPPSIKAPLQALQVWDRFLSESPLSSPAIHSCWGDETLREQDHLYNPYGMGWHVDRRRFDSMLARAAGDAGVLILTDIRHTTCEALPAGGWKVTIRGSHFTRQLQGRFLVDATGRSSSVAHQLRIKRVRYDHMIGAVTFFNECDGPGYRDPTTLIEAAENGWWYSAPLPDDRLVVAYMTDADLLRGRSKALPQHWSDLLGNTTYTLSRTLSWREQGAPRVVHAHSSHLAQVCGDDWLAVGDAALAFDPLAGQGIYWGLEFGMRAAEAISDHLGGEPSEMSHYAEAIAERVNQSLALRSKYYLTELRWPDSPFWRRRHAGQTSLNAVECPGCGFR